MYVKTKKQGGQKYRSRYLSQNLAYGATRGWQKNRICTTCSESLGVPQEIQDARRDKTLFMFVSKRLLGVADRLLNLNISGTVCE